MSLNQFLFDVGSQLQEFIWRDLSPQTRQEEIDRLEHRIEQGSSVLARARAALAELRNHVAERERREAWLASRVEVYLHVGDQPRAWEHALELDRLRKQLQQERERLERRRRTYREQQAYLENLQILLADLQHGSYAQRS
jgi:hypothetical protein